MGQADTEMRQADTEMRQADTEACWAVSRPCARLRRAREVFEKMLSRFTVACVQGFQGHFLVFDVSRTFHRFCESNVKRPQRFAHARNAREPLFTGTFRIDCEGESIFLYSSVLLFF